MCSSSEKVQRITQCEICEQTHFSTLFLLANSYVTRCDHCHFLFLNPQTSDKELKKIYEKNYFIRHTSDNQYPETYLKQSTAKFYLSEISQYRGSKKGRLLEVGCGQGDFLCIAEKENWNVVGIDISPKACKIAQSQLKNGEVYCGELRDFQLMQEQFDVCVLSDVLEHVRSPITLLNNIHTLLKPDGVLFITAPSTRSLSARFMGHKWLEFKPEHLTYFSPESIQTALFKSNFHKVVVKKGWKVLNFNYIKMHFEKYPIPFYTVLLKLISRFLTKKAQFRPYKISGSGMLILCQKAQLKSQKILSVIVPAYNEINTFSTMMNNLLAKKMDGMTIEIIVVESNSTDGTREQALKYQDNNRIKLILEDRPLGKGHAVRAGIKIATGDYILIQDADLEYDIRDYDKLLEPLIHGRCAFVLGSRHYYRNILKMRRLTGKPILSILLNLGHCVFTLIINLLYLQRLYDPFTMYKVFRRDCLYGLTFESNRFEFDCELLIKLIRKGYRPLELPICYTSRSFEEGKKIRLFLDSFLLLKKVFQLRFKKLSGL